MNLVTLLAHARLPARTICCWLTLASIVASSPSVNADDATHVESKIRDAATRAIQLLNRASAGSARQRTCFTCHSQAMPVIVMDEARRRGLRIDEENFAKQLTHTHDFLERSRDRFESGRGTGGGVDTAGYALWTLEAGGAGADENTSAVTQWIITQHKDGHWKTSSNRPPSEASHFTTAYLALRALSSYGEDSQSTEISAIRESTGMWLRETEPTETEDCVSRLLALDHLDADGLIQQSIAELVESQDASGGWSQTTLLAPDAYATGTVLYALHRVGMPVADPVYVSGLKYLLQTQQEDGSWHVASRSDPFQTYYETGFPHGTDQFISTTATAWAALALLNVLSEETAAPYETFPDTAAIAWPEEDLSERLMDGAHQFVEKQIRRANDRRRNRKSQQSKDDERADLSELLGVVDVREPPRMERFGTLDDPAIVAETDQYRITQVRWPVCGRIYGEGLLIEQKHGTIAACIVIPDADQTPEQICGLTSSPKVRAVGLMLAANGFDVLVPAIVSREALKTDDSRRQRADYTQREWIYRQAFHMGRHVIGYDIQRVLAGVDWLHSQSSDHRSRTIGIAGYGEGGLIAMHAAAIDSRIDAALVSGYFGPSDFWQEPIYRNVWSRLNQFGNAEVAALIAPRNLVIEHSPFPEVTGHKGELTTPSHSAVKAEIEASRITDISLITGEENSTVGPWSDDALKQFIVLLAGPDVAIEYPETVEPADDETSSLRAADRQRRTMAELEDHIQHLVRQSEHVRDEFFLLDVMPELGDGRWTTDKSLPTYDAETFIEGAESFREKFAREAMGRFDADLLPPNARTRKVAETPEWTAWDVVLDVHEELFAWGVLVVPKDLKPGEKRPVVVCQHGRNGLPRDTLDSDSTAYNQFAARLAERGFITFAPHNLYRGEDRYRWLDRKANTIGCTLFSFIIAQHDQILRWLDALPYVDGERIAFYGLSYGGETAVRVPTVLKKYCLSICSGDFNQWTRKVAATDQPFSFMNTIEWEMPYWNLGHTFDDAEMTYLMVPRPFMVERGHRDRVGRDRWVAHEFAKVRWLYAQLGLADRVEIEFFQGGHSINGDGTFDFLHKHLDWPFQPGD